MGRSVRAIAVLLVSTFSGNIYAQHKYIDDCRAYALAIEKVVIACDNLKSPSLATLTAENPILGDLKDWQSDWRATQAWLLYDGLQHKRVSATRLKTMIFEHCEKEYLYYFPTEPPKKQ